MNKCLQNTTEDGHAITIDIYKTADCEISVALVCTGNLVLGGTWTYWLSFQSESSDKRKQLHRHQASQGHTYPVITSVYTAERAVAVVDQDSSEVSPSLAALVHAARASYREVVLQSHEVTASLTVEAVTS